MVVGKSGDLHHQFSCRPVMICLMTRPIQHHFVTRAYLEEFTDARGLLHIYERGKDKPFQLTPEKAARQRNYYAVKKQDGSYDDTIEHLLDEKIESPAIAVIRKLGSSNGQLSWDDRIALARWISFQELRTPLQRDGFEGIAANLVKKTMQMMARTPGAIEEGLERLKEQGKDYGVTAEELRKGVENDAFEIKINPVLSLEVMMQAEEFVPIFAEMKWTLLTAPEGASFVTSDHPVLRHDPDKRSPYRFGLASATVEFGLPLTKTKFLLLTHDVERLKKWTELIDAGKNEEANQLRQSCPELNLKTLDVDTTLQLVEGIIRSAPRFLFTPKEDDKYLQLLSKEPWTLRMQMG